MARLAISVTSPGQIPSIRSKIVPRCHNSSSRNTFTVVLKVAAQFPQRLDDVFGGRNSAQ